MLIVNEKSEIVDLRASVEDDIVRMVTTNKAKNFILIYFYGLRIKDEADSNLTPRICLCLMDESCTFRRKRMTRPTKYQMIVCTIYHTVLLPAKPWESHIFKFITDYRAACYPIISSTALFTAISAGPWKLF